MNEELERYSDTSKLKDELDQKRVALSKEREQILGTRDASKANLAALQAKVPQFIPPFFADILTCFPTNSTMN